MEPRTLLQLLGIAVLLAALLVALRFGACLLAAARARRYRDLLASIAGVAAIGAALAAFVVVWFGYAVAHVAKNADTDLRLFLWTVPPYFLLSLALWWLAGKLRQRLAPPGAPPREPSP